MPFNSIIFKQISNDWNFQSIYQKSQLSSERFSSRKRFGKAKSFKKKSYETGQDIELFRIY